MTDTNQTAPTATDPTTTKPSTNLPKSLKDITQAVYFSPDKLAIDAAAYMEHLTNPPVRDEKGGLVGGGLGLSPKFNFDPSAEFPTDTHGIMILPIGKNVQQKDKTGALLVKDGKPVIKRENDFIVIAAVPTLSAINAAKDGPDFVEQSILAKFSSKLRNSFSEKVKPEDVVLPFTVDQFIEKSERGAESQGLQSFHDLAKDLVTAVEKKNIPIKKEILRQVLSSTALAKALYPGVGQGFWQNVLKAAIVLCNLPKHNLSTQIFDKWLVERDTAGLSDAKVGDDEQIDILADGEEEPVVNGATAQPASASA